MCLLLYYQFLSSQYFFKLTYTTTSTYILYSKVILINILVYSTILVSFLLSRSKSYKRLKLVIIIS